MELIDYLYSLVKNRKKIIITETDDRIIEACKIIIQKDICDFIFIGNKTEYLNKCDILKNSTFINPIDVVDEYKNKLYNLRKDKGITLEQSKDMILNNYVYLGCLLLLDNKADGLVSGISKKSSDTIKPALEIIKSKDNFVSSYVLMDTTLGKYIFSDCGLNQNPNSIELSKIATQSINSYKMLFNDEINLAFLSYSTNNSSKHSDIDKVREGVFLAQKENPDIIIDGEMQLDTAINEEVRKNKYKESLLRNNANILIFPNLDSANIGYKLVERFGNNKAYGPILQGLNKPVNDLSRGSSVSDIIGVILITIIQSEN